MTRGQRRAHLVIWLVLPPALLALVAWSINARPPASTVDSGADTEVTP